MAVSREEYIKNVKLIEESNQKIAYEQAKKVELIIDDLLKSGITEIKISALNIDLCYIYGVLKELRKIYKDWKIDVGYYNSSYSYSFVSSIEKFIFSLKNPIDRPQVYLRIEKPNQTHWRNKFG